MMLFIGALYPDKGNRRGRERLPRLPLAKVTRLAGRHTPRAYPTPQLDPRFDEITSHESPLMDVAAVVKLSGRRRALCVDQRPKPRTHACDRLASTSRNNT